MSRHSSPPLFVHSHHLNCVLLDTGSGCASPLSIDGVSFCVGTRSTSRISTVQVGQTVLDRYNYGATTKPLTHFSWQMVTSARSMQPVAKQTSSPYSIPFG